MRTYLNNGWQFFEKWDESVFSNVIGQEVRLPHANAVTPFNCYDESLYQFECGYKKILELHNVTGKTYLLTFEGVAHLAEVFVNGKSLCTHRSGYTAFTVDVTEAVFEGENQIVVRVDSRPNLDQPPFGFVIDYQTYGGIYREVYLEEKCGVYVSDVFVRAEPDSPVLIDVSLKNFSVSADFSLRILNGNSVEFSSSYTAESESFSLSVNFKGKNWSLTDPQIYVLRIETENDVYETTFGVRHAEFKKDGFYLNGEKIKIVGLNRHQSFPYVGYAMPESMQRRDARILKNDLAVNAVRTSHYPQSQYFVDECDKLGLLVFTEIPGWQHIGGENWKKQALENVYEMVTQYRNHPSVILWGVRINESADCDELYEKTNALARRLDPSRQTGGVRRFAKSHLLEDVYTFNDFNREGASDRNGICGKNVPYLVTEYNGHMYPTKTFDSAPHRMNHALKYAKMLDGVFGSENSAGCFGWCMFDYNTHKDFGSGDRICYHGVTDMFRNPKWASGVFSSLGEKPFLEAAFTADIGDYPESAVGDMYCFTNADSVKVYRGEKFIKEYSHKDSPFKNLPNAPILIDDLIGNRLIDEEGFSVKNSERTKKCIKAIRKYGANGIPFKIKITVAKIMASQKLSMAKLTELYGKYEANWGREVSDIRLEGYKNGKLAAVKTVGSSKGYELKVTVSHTDLVEGSTYDVAAVNIFALDCFGNVCPYVNRAVTFKTEGEIELIGEKRVALAGGMFGTYVKTTGRTGKGKLFVDDVEVEFDVRAANG